jgi:hypothetical protein
MSALNNIGSQLSYNDLKMIKGGYEVSCSYCNDLSGTLCHIDIGGGCTCGSTNDPKCKS